MIGGTASGGGRIRRPGRRSARGQGGANRRGCRAMDARHPLGTSQATLRLLPRRISHHASHHRIDKATVRPAHFKNAAHQGRVETSVSGWTARAGRWDGSSGPRVQTSPSSSMHANPNPSSGGGQDSLTCSMYSGMRLSISGLHPAIPLALQSQCRSIKEVGSSPASCDQSHFEGPNALVGESQLIFREILGVEEDTAPILVVLGGTSDELLAQVIPVKLGSAMRGTW